MKNTMRYNFQVNVYETREEMGRSAARDCAECIKALLKEKEEINMIFAAAPSQNEFLAAMAADKDIEFSRINAFHMDEYIGLEKGAPQGFGEFLRTRIFDLAGFKSVNYINASAADADEECMRYGKLLKEHPVDIVCMGIGENGHIAFNDPHVAEFNDKKIVKAVELDEVCRMQQVNDGCFAKIDDVPKKALTLTIPTLAAAAHHFCIVPAKTKAEAVKRTIKGEITEKCPATILRMCPDARVYLDSDSSEFIK